MLPEKMTDDAPHTNHIYTNNTSQSSFKLNPYVQRKLILFSIFAFIVLNYGEYIVINQYKMLEQKKMEYIKAKKELEILKEENKELNREVMLLNNDEYIMQVVRKEYFLSKEGEIIFQIREAKE